MRKIVFMLFIILGASSFTAFSPASAVSSAGTKLYQITNEVKRTINLSIESTDYNFALVTINIWEKLVYAIQTNFQLQRSPYILADSSHQKSAVLNLSSLVDVGIIYVFIYSKSVLFESGVVRPFPTLNASNIQYEEAQFEYLDKSSYPYLYGHSLENNGNDQIDDNEYRNYKTSGEQSNNLTFYFQVEKGTIVAFLVYGAKTISKENVDRNITQFMNKSVNSHPNILNFAIFSNSNGYLSYNSSSKIELTLVVSQILLNSTDYASYRFYSTAVFEGYSIPGWYNAWFIDWFRTLALGYPPYAVLILAFVSTGVSLSTIGAAHLILDVKQLRKDQKRVTHHNKLKRKAQETADRKLWLKIQSNDPRIKELSRKIQFKLLVPRLLTALPFLLIFTTFRGAFGSRVYNLAPDRGEILAVFPFTVPSWIPLIGGWFSQLHISPEFTVAGFGTAYLLAALTSSVFIQRFLGINIQIISPENPLKSQ